MNLMDRMTPFVAGCIVALLLICAAMCFRKKFARQSMLLIGSYLFYATWGLPFLAILVASSVFNFVLGAWLRKSPTLGRLWAGIIFNVLLLSFFKYLSVMPGVPDSILHIAMPVGMSFWTFQALSYLFDIYREEELDPSLVEFCLYMAFWPTVLMGPICRLPRMLTQFRETSGFSLENFVPGLKRVGMGLIMKLILAQLLGSALGGDFDGAGRNWGGLDVWCLAIGFGFQLFFDFAGYSNIVIGAAQMFGFQLEENFDSPYLSSTPSVFWTRWHMSLSSWIRDYVFIPAATLRRAQWWRYVALILSMMLFGLWHGAKLTFVLWGLYQGVFLMLHRMIQQLQRRFNLNLNGALGDLSAWCITFLGISLGWILFRANDLHAAAVMYRAIFSLSSYGQMELSRNYYILLVTLVTGYFAYHTMIHSGLFLKAKEKLQNTGMSPKFLQLCWMNRWWALTPMIAMLVVFAGLMVWFQSSGVTPFIYAGF